MIAKWREEHRLIGGATARDSASLQDQAMLKALGYTEPEPLEGAP